MNSVFASTTYFFFADTFTEAKRYAARNRAVWPVDYCEDERTERASTVGRQTEKNKLLQEIQVKVEKITNMQRAITTLNQTCDKQKIDYIDASDVEEFDDMLLENGNNLGADDDDTESIISVMTIPSSGMGRLDIDQQFSAEYCFETDVS